MNKIKLKLMNQLEEVDTYQKLIGFYKIYSDHFEHDYSKDFKEIATTHEVNEIVESMKMVL